MHVDCMKQHTNEGSVVYEESLNKRTVSLDHYFRDNRVFRSVMITLSPLEPIALGCMFSVTLFGKI